MSGCGRTNEVWVRANILYVDGFYWFENIKHIFSPRWRLLNLEVELIAPKCHGGQKKWQGTQAECSVLECTHEAHDTSNTVFWTAWDGSTCVYNIFLLFFMCILIQNYFCIRWRVLGCQKRIFFQVEREKEFYYKLPFIILFHKEFSLRGFLPLYLGIFYINFLVSFFSIFCFIPYLVTCFHKADLLQ